MAPKLDLPGQECTPSIGIECASFGVDEAQCRSKTEIWDLRELSWPMMIGGKHQHRSQDHRGVSEKFAELPKDTSLTECVRRALAMPKTLLLRMVRENVKRDVIMLTRNI